ncbi:MAG: nitroreductase family protein [Vulcanimicrobiaceae bacterium]
MDVFEAMLGRRSVGALGGDVDDAAIARLLDVAVRAPNHKLTRPWRFTVVRGDARARLGAVWAAVFARETTLSGESRDAAIQREARKPMRSPAIIVASTRTHDDPVVADEDFAATAAAVENVLLGAHALGLGAIWRTGAMARRAEINAFLELDARDRIVAFVYLGQPAGALPQPIAYDRHAVVRVLE